MSSTLIHWTPEEDLALTRVQLRFIAERGQFLTRPAVLRALLAEADAGSQADTIRPPAGGQEVP